MESPSPKGRGIIWKVCLTEKVGDGARSQIITKQLTINEPINACGTPRTWKIQHSLATRQWQVNIILRLVS